MNKNNVVKLDIDYNESRKYKIKIIWDSMVYAKKSKLGYHLLKLYDLIFEKAT